PRSPTATHSACAKYSSPSRTQKQERHPPSARYLSSIAQETAPKSRAGSRGPCRCRTSTRPACCRRQSPVHDATAPSPERLCHYRCLSASTPYTARARRKCPPGPTSCAQTLPVPSAAARRESCPSLAAAKTRRSSDAPESCARNRLARARVASLILLRSPPP